MMQWWILDSYQITLKWLDNRFLLTNNNLVILCYDSDKLGIHLLGERESQLAKDEDEDE